MGLLAGYRRFWALLLLALLAVPMAIQAMQPAAVSSEGEARMLSAAPAWPQSPRDWLALPRQLDRFLADHFGLRAELVRAHGRLRYAVDLPSDLRVIIGRDNWLFLNGDGTIEQATGKTAAPRRHREIRGPRRRAARPSRREGRAISSSRSRRTARRSTARACPPGPPRRRRSPNTIS